MLHDGYRCCLCSDEFIDGDRVSSVPALVQYSVPGQEQGIYIMLKYHNECREIEEMQ